MRYLLTAQAKLDLSEIYEYGIERFGIAQADLYLDEMYDEFDQIAYRPLSYPAAKDIDAGYRRAPFKSQSIYFRVDEVRDEIVIVRVFGRQNPGAAFG